MLFLLYQASLSKQVSTDAIPSIDQAVKHWREEIIKPIRQLRNLLKTNNYPLPNEQQSTLRNEVLKLELSAEKLEQAQLEALDIPLISTTSYEAAESSIFAYINYLSTSKISSSGIDEFKKLLEYFRDYINGMQSSA